MSVRINSINIKVQARAFHASFELWQLQGNSLNPKWQRSDLRYTRVTDPKRGEVLYGSSLNVIRNVKLNTVTVYSGKIKVSDKHEAVLWYGTSLVFIDDLVELAGCILYSDSDK